MRTHAALTPLSRARDAGGKIRATQAAGPTPPAFTLFTPSLSHFRTIRSGSPSPMGALSLRCFLDRHLWLVHAVLIPVTVVTAAMFPVL